MANNFGRVNVSVTASTGGLTAGLASAGKQLKGFQQAASSSGDTFSSLTQSGDEAGVVFSDVSGLFGTFGSSMIAMAKNAGIAAFGVQVLTAAVKTLLIPLAVIGAVTAPFRAIADAAGRLDDAGKSAERLGLSIGMFQTLSAVADEVGLSVSTMSSVLTKMQMTLVKAGEGAKPAVDALQAIGLNAAALQGMSTAQQFEAISAAIMGIPDPAQRTAAAVAIFGKNAAQAMAFIKEGANGAIAEMEKLNSIFGVDITEVQRQGVNQMNDALGRLAIPVTGFINQLTAGIAPAITTVATMVLDFLKGNADGWGLAEAMAQGFTAALRYVSAAVTTIYGMFQLLWGILATGESLLQRHLVAPMFRFLADWSGAIGTFITKLENGFRQVLQVLTYPIQELLKLLSTALDKIGQSGLADQLRGTANSMATLSSRDSGAGAGVANSADWARKMADAADQAAGDLAQQAAQSIQDGLNNIENPFQAWDETMLQVMNKAREEAAKVEDALKSGGEKASQAIAASSKELKAIVAGTSEGEAFRNALARGADPRLDGKEDAKRAADAGERTADEIEGLREDLAMNFGLAAIQV
jgi:hypothetical protein